MPFLSLTMKHAALSSTVQGGLTLAPPYLAAKDRLALRASWVARVSQVRPSGTPATRRRHMSDT